MTDIKELEMICLSLITSAGEARTNYVNAITEAQKGNFENAERNMECGDDAFNAGHHVHADIIQKEAAGDGPEMSLLMVHAEDQMMASEVFRFVAEQMINLYKERMDT